MALRSKAAYSERKGSKSTFILTVNSPVHPSFTVKETACSTGRLARPQGPGGFDFLIAYALLILCHFLFEIVIVILLDPAVDGADLAGILKACDVLEKFSAAASVNDIKNDLPAQVPAHERQGIRVMEA